MKLPAWLERLFDFFGLRGRRPTDPNDPCHAPACVEAKIILGKALSLFLNACWASQALQSIRTALGTIASTPLWVIVVMLAIAAIFGGLVAAIIMELLAVYAVAWLLLFLIPKSCFPTELARILSDASAEIADTIPEVVANCPESCRGDLSAFQCDLA